MSYFEPRESAKLLEERLPKLAESSAVLITGDFNCTDLEEPYKRLTQTWRDCYREIHVRCDDEATYHAFQGATAGRRFDWILHSGCIICHDAQIDRKRMPNGRFPSDHFAVTATLQWVIV